LSSRYVEQTPNEDEIEMKNQLSEKKSYQINTEDSICKDGRGNEDQSELMLVSEIKIKTLLK
jgi:hypothetical protein